MSLNYEPSDGSDDSFNAIDDEASDMDFIPDSPKKSTTKSAKAVSGGPATAMKTKTKTSTKKAATSTGTAVSLANAVDHQNVEVLVEKGIAAADVQKLKAGGYHTVASVLMANLKDLAEVKGLTEQRVSKLVTACKTIRDEAGGLLLTGNQAMEKRLNVHRIQTGASQLDELLGGGIETQSLTELFGEFRTGKTQICHTLAVTAQCTGESPGKVVYIDTEGSFRPERIVQIANRFGYDGTELLENILYARVHSHEAQIELISEISKRIAEDDTQYRLVIIDSVTALFRSEFTGRGQLAERQQLLNQYLAKLTKMADEFNLSVLMTNQVTADPGNAMAFAAAAQAKPIGGNILAHASTTRLFLRKGKGNQRIMKIYDSPSLPESEATYAIEEVGITDAE